MPHDEVEKIAASHSARASLVKSLRESASNLDKELRDAWKDAKGVVGSPAKVNAVYVGIGALATILDAHDDVGALLAFQSRAEGKEGNGAGDERGAFEAFVVDRADRDAPRDYEGGFRVEWVADARPVLFYDYDIDGDPVRRHSEVRDLAAEWLAWQARAALRGGGEKQEAGVPVAWGVVDKDGDHSVPSMTERDANWRVAFLNGNESLSDDAKESRPYRVVPLYAAPVSAGGGAEKVFLEACEAYVVNARDSGQWGKEHDKKHTERFGVLLAAYDALVAARERGR